MNPTYHAEEEERKRSLMYAKPYMCNGQATGKQCKHYWHSVVPLDVLNSVAIHQGETSRQCVRHPGVEIRLNAEDGGQPEMATLCNQYEASTRPYDPTLEEYNPLSPEEIEERRAGPELAQITSNKPSLSQRLQAFFQRSTK